MMERYDWPLSCNNPECPGHDIEFRVVEHNYGWLNSETFKPNVCPFCGKNSLRCPNCGQMNYDCECGVIYEHQ